MLQIFLAGGFGFPWAVCLILLFIIHGLITGSKEGDRDLFIKIGFGLIFIIFLIGLIVGYSTLVANCDEHFRFAYKYVDYTYEDLNDCIYNNKDNLHPSSDLQRGDR